MKAVQNLYNIQLLYLSIMKLLVIEDETSLRESILSYFTEQGTICEGVADFQSAVEKINLYNYDCILLDLGLAGSNGLDILRLLKRLQKQDGVLIISARHSLDDRLEGLNLGADDYLVKPFHLSELKARVIAIVRRKKFDGSNTITYKEIDINLLSMEVIIQHNVLNLTRKEYDMLIYLIANQEKVVSKNAIAEHIWGDGIDLSDHFDFIYSHIKNLRRKLVAAGAKDYIKSVYGIGYKLGE